MKKRTSPLMAEWEGLDDKTGEMVIFEIRPDDILQDMADGLNVKELCVKYNCPRELVEHCIMCIPEMMVWRDVNF